MTNKYKLILFVRFVGYLLFFCGFLTMFFILGPLAKVEAEYRLDKVFGVKKKVPKIITSESSSSASVDFGDIKVDNSTIIPASTQFGIVIEKINANAAVIPNVNAGNEKQYTQALTKGVAQALGSTLPGERGNLFLFSHSTNASWNIIRFNAVFYLLRELEIGDKIIIFYQNKRFDYEVFDKKIVSPSDISFITNRYDVPVLTLQTCDPPGTLLNRLIIRAKLVGT
jgi:LPXTG-site transpeptidase (sortase) family protein